MRRKKNWGSALVGAFLFFITVAAVVTAAVLVYTCVEDKCAGNYAALAGVMLAVIVVCAAIITLIDYLRRRFTVDKPVQKILDATDRVASGDFSVRLQTRHGYRRFDEYDCIMDNLNKMAAELSRSEIMRTDFISNVSHELKTPLSVIANYAAALKVKDIDDATRAEYAQTLVNTAQKLTVLVTNILKLNKLENERIKPEKQMLGLTEMLEEAAIGFEDAIERKGINFECELEQGVKIFAPPEYLEIVWNNLLSNAIKFTESGGVVALRLKMDGDKAVVTVEDSGCGISAETGRHIFDKFYQGDTSHSREGNGLGLALVKKVIDITGGTITVDSRIGEGTSFTVTLNAAR